MLDSNTARLFDHLHRSGQWGYWWAFESRQSFWWEVGKRTPLPGGKYNTYFGVHPTSTIPEKNARGEPCEPSGVRAQIAYIAAVSALFAEYDAKDFGNNKADVLTVINALDPSPSVVVDSGGGYHCYWLLDTPWILKDQVERERARKLQAAWVLMVGADPQSKDLARVLRIPGTYNHKYDPPRRVTIIRSDFNRTYALTRLATLAEPFIENDRTAAPASSNADGAHQAWLIKALAGEIAKVASTPDGTKHERLLDSAVALGGLVHLGLGEQTIRDGLLGAIEGRAADKKNAIKTIEDGIAYGKQRPRDIPTPPQQFAQHTNSSPVPTSPAQSGPVWGAIIPFHTLDLPVFPTDVFPPWLRAFVEAISTEKQTPVDLAAMLALSILSTACARFVEVHARPGWIEPVNVYTMTVLPPASGKSPTFSAMVAPLEVYEREQVAASKLNIARKQSEHDLLDAQLANAKRLAASAKSAADMRAASEQVQDLTEQLVNFEVPAEPRLIVDDITSERLGTMLVEQKGRIAALSPEGDIFSIMGGRYSADNAPNFNVYLRSHAREPLRIDRSKRAEYVERPALTMGLTIQPDVLRSFADRKMFRGQGLLSRFLYCVPKSLVGYRDVHAAACPDVIRRTYHAMVQHLVRIVPILASTNSEDCGNYGNRQIENEDNDNTGIDMVHENTITLNLTLSPSAHALSVQFHQWLEPQLVEDGGELGHIADWGSKMRGGIFRLAGLLHMAEYASSFGAAHNSHNTHNAQINELTMARAIAIVQYLIPHARAAFAEIGADPALVAARKVLSWIEKMTPRDFSKRDVYQAVKGTFKRASELDPVLELLSDHGYIRPRDMDERSGPGRKPSQVFDVNPALYRPSARSAASIAPVVSPFSHTPSEAALVPQNGYHAPVVREPEVPVDDEGSAPAPTTNGYRALDWTLLEASYRAGNMTAITAHCSIRQQSIPAVMDELAVRTGIERAG
jgi:replicative DNA helicase